MKDEQVEELHKYLLEIFNEFQNICSKYNLTYFAIAGTTLGTIRHNGFIPWDDDLDVGMPLNDYLKFREIASKELNSPFHFIDTLDKKRSKNFFYKIENEQTTFVEMENKKYKKGIWIDIFPFSGVPDNNFKLYWYLKKAHLYLRFDYYHNIEFNECISVKNKLLKTICNIVSCHREKNYYIKKFENLMKKYDFYKSKKVFYAWRLKFSYKVTKKYTLFDSTVFKRTITHKFENTNINIPIGYDSYLKTCYGDYMKLPSKEKRKIHEPYILDFKKSYKEY